MQIYEYNNHDIWEVNVMSIILRTKASFRLSNTTIKKLKEMSDQRKKNDQENWSQGKIIDEAVNNLEDGVETFTLKYKTKRRLNKMAKENNMPIGAYLDFLIMNAELDVQVVPRLQD